MITTLRTDITIEELCNGFVYNELEGKGLYGLSGKLVIQPEYQRNYLYAQEKKEEAVVDSVLKEYPLGLIYFNKVGDEQYEVLDGQQRITSLGRFMTGKFPLIDGSGTPHYFASMPQDRKNLINNTMLTIYICEGTETEIKDWFRTINIVGLPLKPQEISNSVYCGPFVTLAKEEFSNSSNANVQKWSAYINGQVNRQDYLERALEWVTRCDGKDKQTRRDTCDEYMSLHRFDNNIDELKNYFTSVIDWISTTFIDVESKMKGLEWGRMYEQYHNNPYDPAAVSEKVHELYADPAVTNKKGVFEYILGGCTDTKLLEIRLFSDSVKAAKYTQQTNEAKANGTSNCPLCAIGADSNRTKIWKQDEMDADHVAAWSEGGATDIENCQMLCKTHNRAKGNK